VKCHDFLDRLYDDDVRRALREGSVPSDLSPHMLECQGCQAAYQAAATDERLLTRALREMPPPHWHATVLRDLSRRTPVLKKPWIATINEAVAWGVLAIAASHVLLNDHSAVGQIVAFGTGSAAALLRPTRTKPGHLLRRSLRWV
jgi:hypothetical protein